jgi:hypothetical protein
MISSSDDDMQASVERNALSIVFSALNTGITKLIASTQAMLVSTYAQN